MRKKENKVRKFFGNRGFWGIVCFILNMYFIAVNCGIYGLKQFYLMYVNVWGFLPITVFAALAIYLARMEKNFFRGIQIAFSRKRNVSRIELQKALNAIEYAEKNGAEYGICGKLSGS